MKGNPLDLQYGSTDAHRSLDERQGRFVPCPTSTLAEKDPNVRLGVAKWKRSKCHHGFNPCIFFEQSATPAEGAIVLGEILCSELNPEEMIKRRGLHTHNKASSEWCDTICVFESETGDPGGRHWSAEMPHEPAES